MSEPPEAGVLMALLMEVNQILSSRAEAAEVYARVSDAVRERLGAFCVAVVYVRSAADLTVRALSAAPSFSRSGLSDLLKEGRHVGEMLRALRRGGLYARRLQTERALHMAAVPLMTQRGAQVVFLLALSASEFASVSQETLQLVARLLGSMRPGKG